MRDTGDRTAAAQHFRRGLAIADHLIRSAPADLGYQRDLALLYERLADLAGGIR
ncbi:hypothetical protein [Nocardia abscessus]|uniref:hypothetical protein n=1 Tax=Nocardia abscessus TaxID=120957 RepID=UPI002455217B|nr:hypothetical protein [Nocardia abscessus]